MSATSTAPRRAQVISAAPIAWNTGDAFDGYIAILTALPNFEVEDVLVPTASIMFADSLAAQVIPIRAICAVVGGVISQDFGLFFNSDMQPPHSQYVAYWLDPQKRTIAGPSVLFTVSSSPYTITVPALTAPDQTITIPELQT